MRTMSEKKRQRPTPTPLQVTSLLVLLASFPLGSQETDGFRDSLEHEWGSAVYRVEQIGAAIPESIYDWRPGEDVRSVAEVLMHIAGGNFRAAEILGESRPEDLPADLSKVVAGPGPEVRRDPRIRGQASFSGRLGPGTTASAWRVLLL